MEAVLRIGTRLDWYGRFFLEKKNGNWSMKMELNEKLTSGFIEAYIPSLDTAAYLRSIDHHFSELEKATIIGNHHSLSDAEKLEALQRMKETTEDEALRERLERAIQIIREGNEVDKAFPVREVLFDFFAIPHDFRHGDIVKTVGEGNPNLLGVILGYDERACETYCKQTGDYSDVQVWVEMRFLVDPAVYRRYDYLGEFFSAHVNPIYIERARLPHDDVCGWYLEYLADPFNPMAEQLAERVLINQLEKVGLYSELSFMELLTTAASTAKSLRYTLEGPDDETISLPEEDEFDFSKVKCFELMDGLYHMLPPDVRADIEDRIYQVPAESKRVSEVYVFDDGKEWLFEVLEDFDNEFNIVIYDEGNNILYQGLIGDIPVRVCSRKKVQQEAALRDNALHVTVREDIRRQ